MDQDNFEQDRKKKKSGNGKLIIILAVVLVLAAGCGVGFYMHSNKQAEVAAEKEKTADPEKTQEQYDKLKEEVSADVDPNDPMYRKIDFAAAQGTNPDVYAWIWIPGTNVDYPILQSATEPDEYYLNHTIERKGGQSIQRNTIRRISMIR